MKQMNGQRWLALYSGAQTLVVAVLFLSGFGPASGGHERFDTITVQRINIVEPDGKLRMVLTNNRRIPGVIMHGREYADYGNRKASTAAGILFYDAQATESGGLTFGGRKEANGAISRFGHFSFDRYDQDQMFTISAIDDGTNHLSSVKMIDQPNWSVEEYLQLRDRIRDLPPAEQQAAIDAFLETHPLGAGVRTLLSSETYPSAPTFSRNVLHLRDGSGRDRGRLGIDANGKPTLEFLDESGTVTHTYPPQP